MIATTRSVMSVSEPVLFVAFELGNKDWKLAMTSGFGVAPWVRTVASGDWAAVERSIAHGRARFAVPVAAAVVSCYEAGRDGFWIHRALIQASGRQRERHATRGIARDLVQRRRHRIGARVQRRQPRVDHGDCRACRNGHRSLDCGESDFADANDRVAGFRGNRELTALVRVQDDWVGERSAAVAEQHHVGAGERQAFAVVVHLAAHHAAIRGRRTRKHRRPIRGRRTRT